MNPVLLKLDNPLVIHRNIRGKMSARRGEVIDIHIAITLQPCPTHIVRTIGL